MDLAPVRAKGRLIVVTRRLALRLMGGEEGWSKCFVLCALRFEKESWSTEVFVEERTHLRRGRGKGN